MESHLMPIVIREGEFYRFPNPPQLADVFRWTGTDVARLDRAVRWAAAMGEVLMSRNPTTRAQAVLWRNLARRLDTVRFYQEGVDIGAITPARGAE